MKTVVLKAKDGKFSEYELHQLKVGIIAVNVEDHSNTHFNEMNRDNKLRVLKAVLGTDFAKVKGFNDAKSNIGA